MLTSMEHIFQCPECRSALDWPKRRCKACGLTFAMDGGIVDFLGGVAMSDQNKQEIHLHETLADRYHDRYKDEFAKLFSGYWNKLFLSYLPKKPGLVLDCGCGTGELAAALLPYANQVVGCDISKAMMRQAQKKIPGWREMLWAACLGEKLPFGDNLFDVVCYRGALHHMADEIKALGEARRVLKKGGLVMMSEPNDDAVWLRLPRRFVNRKMKRFGNHHKAFRSGPWKQAIAAAGFSIRHSRYFSYLTEPVCGMSDLLPLMNHLPNAPTIAAGLMKMDAALARLPFIRRQSFELFIVAGKN